MKYGFGVDIGGTTVKLGCFRQDGALLKQWEIPTRTELGGDVIFDDISGAVLGCAEGLGIARQDVLGLGVGIPGPVDDGGNVNCCVNLKLGVFNLRQTLESRTGLAVRAGNDANLAALGEYYDGGGRGSQSMLMVTIGTGVGGGFVWNGRVLNGFHGVAGELGHVTIDRNEPERCTCGKFGCAEQYASATGMVRLAKQRLAACDTPSALRQVPELTAKALFDCAGAGDALALEVLERVYDVLGQAIADSCCICDPELVVVGGGVSKAGQPLLDGIAHHFAKYCFHAARSTRFALAKLGNSAGIYGGFRLISGRET